MHTQSRMTPRDDHEDHKGHWLGKERLKTHVPEERLARWKQKAADRL